MIRNKIGCKYSTRFSIIDWNTRSEAEVAETQGRADVVGLVVESLAAVPDLAAVRAQDAREAVQQGALP